MGDPKPRSLPACPHLSWAKPQPLNETAPRFVSHFCRVLLLSSAEESFVPSAFTMDSWNSFPRETPDCREEMMMNVSSLSNSDSPDGYTVLYETD